MTGRVTGALVRRVRRTNRRGIALARRGWWALSPALAFVWRRLLVRTTVIGITGSLGKTTAKECMVAVLSAGGATVGTRHNRNDRYGLPTTILRVRPWHRFAVIEVGVREPGAMAPLARIVRPDIAVVLSVAQTHVRNYTDLDAIAAEKVVLVDHLRPGGTFVLNVDDERVAAMTTAAGIRRVGFGRGAGATIRAENVEARWPGRLGFDLVEPLETGVSTQLVGTQWLSSALAALAVAEVCGIDLAVAADRLAEVPPFTARMQPLRLPNGATVIRDEKGSSPDTVAAMLEVAADATASRRGLVFSDISDTKKKTRRRLSEVGRTAAKTFDYAIFIGDHAHRSVRAAVDAGMDPAQVVEATSAEAASAALRKMAQPDDLIFLKGRSTDHLSRIAFAQFGSIGCWKQTCARTHVCDLCPELDPGFDFEATLGTAADLSAPDVG